MDKYQRIKTIGKGAFGEAVLVRSAETGELYVSKEIALANLSKKDKESTETEIRILAAVDHPNVTKYIESFHEKGILYIILEFADGGDLHGRIKKQSQTGGRGGPILFPEAQIRHWFVQLCLALQELHSRKILHRDLKTRNVFLTSTEQIKLGDFGLSTVLKNTMEQANTMCGTPYYFSPELCNNKPYNSKSDVWALGCILYEMCTLKHAFDAKSMGLLMQKIVRGLYPPICRSYSPELHRLIRMMLEKDETRRPSVTAILELPYMQSALMLLSKNLCTMTTEEEMELSMTRQKQAAELLTQAIPVAATLAPSSTHQHSTADSPQTRANKEEQTQELVDIRNVDRAKLKALLSGPPPEILNPTPPKPPAQQQPRGPAPQGVTPNLPRINPCLPGQPQDLLPSVAVSSNNNVTDTVHGMRLGNAQYNTLTGQISRLMCKEEGQRSAAGMLDTDVVVDNEVSQHQVETKNKPTADGIRQYLIKEIGTLKFHMAYNILLRAEGVEGSPTNLPTDPSAPKPPHQQQASATVESDKEEETIAQLQKLLGGKIELLDLFGQLLSFESAGK